jgi:hypothetical protein
MSVDIRTATIAEPFGMLRLSHSARRSTGCKPSSTSSRKSSSASFDARRRRVCELSRAAIGRDQGRPKI